MAGDAGARHLTRVAAGQPQVLGRYVSNVSTLSLAMSDGPSETSGRIVWALERDRGARNARVMLTRPGCRWHVLKVANLLHRLWLGEAACASPG
jgi:hypothetical protein